MIRFLVVLFINVHSTEAVCNGDYSGLSLFCNARSGYFLINHCFYLISTTHDNIDDSIADCATVGSNTIDAISGLAPFTGTIANFYTYLTYSTVMSTLGPSMNEMDFRIGLISNVSKPTDFLNTSDFVWINSVSHLPVGQWMWNITFANKTGNQTWCSAASGTSYQNMIDLIPCYSYTPLGTICELMCKEDNIFCWDCPLEGSSITASYNIKQINETTAAATADSLVMTTKNPNISNVCVMYKNGLLYNGKCYILVNTTLTWKAALNSCQRIGQNNNCFGRLATFNTFDDLDNVTSKLLGDYNNVGEVNKIYNAWIGMTTPCYCTTNFRDYIWAGSTNQILSGIQSDLQYGMGEVDEYPFQSCIYSLYVGNLRNDRCNDSSAQYSFICEFTCQVQQLWDLGVGPNCSSNISTTSNVDSCYTTTTMTTKTALTSRTTLTTKTVSTSITSMTTKTALTSITSSANTKDSSSILQPNTQPNPPMSTLFMPVVTVSDKKFSSYQTVRSFNTTVGLQHTSNTDKPNYIVTSDSDNTAIYYGEDTTIFSEITVSYSNSDCIIGPWMDVSQCSATCGLSATKIRYRKVVQVNENSVCPKGNETVICNLTQCNPMSPTVQVVATVMQGLGCSWLIGLCTGCLVVSVLLKSWDMNRFIHASQEIALILAHILIATARNETRNFHLCTSTSIAIQYFFIVLFAFLTLEAVHIYTLVTTVINDGGSFFGFPATASLGWGLPVLVVAGTAMTSYKHYISTFSCWLNFGNRISFGTIIPIAACCCVTAILVEAAGQRANRDLQFGNSNQVLSARINQRSLLIITALQVAAWFVGQSAVYYQNIALFSTVFALNLALGSSISFFHILANAEGRAYVMQKWKKIKPKRINKVDTCDQNVELKCPYVIK